MNRIRMLERGLIMKYIVEIMISIILIILILYIVGFFLRKKLYQEVDRLDLIKVELMNRPIAEHLSKVKKLTMAGETEERFEYWRKKWDDILFVYFPNVEEYLFLAEEHIDKYQFKQARSKLNQVEELLQTIDSDMERIVEELEQLINIEEKNRTDMEELLNTYNQCKRDLLAQRHVFGIASDHLDQMITSIGENIQKFNELTTEGNYIEAKEIVEELAKKIHSLEDKMTKIPDLYTECHSIIPAELKELQAGYQEMVDQKYVLDHLHFEKRMEELKGNLDTYLEWLKAGEISDVEKGIQETKETIENLYDQLEKEVYAKQYVLQHLEATEIVLQDLEAINQEIQEETKTVLESYHLLEKELETPQKLDKNLKQAMNRFELLVAKTEEAVVPSSLLEEELKSIQEQLSTLEQEQKEFQELLQNLRKDEMEARAKMKELQRKINEIIRNVQQSHLPGLPDDVVALFDKAEEQMNEVMISLQEKPLNMKAVQHYLDGASDTINHLYTKAIEHLENAELAERVIQYANRYRRQDPVLAQNLDKAEELFRQYEYLAALEQAATAVEQVEPGALKRIEQLYREAIKEAE